MNAAPPVAPIKLFCVHHEEDGWLYDELRVHLKPLAAGKKFEIRHPGDILGGSPPEARAQELSAADVVALLLSPDLRTDDRWWTELEKAMRAQRPWVVPVLLRTTAIQDTALEGREILPRGSERPVARMKGRAERDSAWHEIAQEIGKVIDEVRRSGTSLGNVQERKVLAYRLKYEGRHTASLTELRRALEDLDLLAGAHPVDASLTTERAHLLDRIGQCEYALGRFEEARRLFDQALEIRQALSDADPASRTARHDLSISRYWRGYLSYLRGDHEQACIDQREGRRLCEALVAEEPHNRKFRRGVVVLATDLGTTLQEMGDLAGAEEELRSSLALARRLSDDHPDDWQLRRDVSVGLFRLAAVLLLRGRAPEAAPLCEESVDRCLWLTDGVPWNAQWRRHLAVARLSMGDAHRALDQAGLARGDYEFAVGTLGALAALENDNLHGSRQLALAEEKLASLACREDRHREAVTSFSRAAFALERACVSVSCDRYHNELERIYVAWIGAIERATGPEAGEADGVRAKLHKLRARRPVGSTPP